MAEFDTTLRLTRNVICQCGYQLMNTPVGTLYRAIAASKHPGHLLCGGCNRLLRVTLILCEQKRHPDHAEAYLVFDVMEVVPD